VAISRPYPNEPFSLRTGIPPGMQGGYLSHRSAPLARYDMPSVPALNLRVTRRPYPSELIERATRRRVALLCAPAGAGKTMACTRWAAGTSRKVVWVTLDVEDDQRWFWALLCSGLERVCAVPANALRALQDESANGFPLLLAHEAQTFTESVVIVLDNVHRLTDDVVLAGLDLLICHAPAGLGFLLSGRRRPMLNLERLRAAGELAAIGVADLGWDLC
jgi:LuxR family transcriptional regulator, maltose regulon positive regulatory protein